MGKLTGARHAVGYWGQNPYKRIRQGDQTAEKIRVLLHDKLRSLGKSAYLYVPVTPDTPGVTACTCVRDTTDQADQPCYTCHGTHYAPGYLRFGHQTLYWASAEAADFTLVGCALDTTIRPHRVLMSAGTTTATVETTDKGFTAPGSDLWSMSTNAMLRAAGNAVTVEFSTDAGTTWYAASEVNNAVVGLSGTGTVRLRITLSRAAAGDKSPAWEVTRLRRPEGENVNRMLLKKSGYAAGEILILRTWAVEQMGLDPARGQQIGHLQDRGWTAPLDFFDVSLTRDTPAVKIRDRDAAGPHPFYELRHGIRAGDRYAIVSVSYNEQFDIFTHQSWADRLTQPGESYGLVW